MLLYANLVIFNSTQYLGCQYYVSIIWGVLSVILLKKKIKNPIKCFNRVKYYGGKT